MNDIAMSGFTKIVNFQETPISDRRLILHKNGQVTFGARTGNTPGGGRAETQAYTLSGREFVRRWSLHILPKGYVKTRRFGQGSAGPALGGKAVAAMRDVEIKDRAERHDAGRIDGLVAVIIVPLDLLDIDRLLHPGHLIEIADIA